MGRSVAASRSRSALFSFRRWMLASAIPVTNQIHLPPHFSTFSSPTRPSYFNPIVRSLPAKWASNRSLSSDSAGPSNIVLVKSEEDFNHYMKKVQDDGVPAIFYFTAVWCGPCKFISPIIEELSGKHAHVTTYKVDIDQEALGNKLSDLKIYSVPTLHFFKDGKKATEIIGADVAQLKKTMESLYK